MSRLEPTTALDGKEWLARLHGLQQNDRKIGRWADALLTRARKLKDRGLLRADVPEKRAWRGDRRVWGEDWDQLQAEHRDWLAEQARVLKAVSRRSADPVGQCASHFIDWIIWFWTADGCHPRTHCAQRDAIKHDCRYLYSTVEARQRIARARATRVAIPSVVQHEHAVPKRELIELVLGDKMSPYEALERFARAVVVSNAEHELLNRRFRERMPPGWDPTSPSADPFARYHAVNIIVDSPLGR